MVGMHNKAKTSFIVLLVVASLVVVAVASIALFRADQRRTRGYESLAAAAGVVRAQKECLKAGRDLTDCKTITGVASAAECRSRLCWTVVFSTSNHRYVASAIVTQEDDGYIVTNYMGADGTHL